MRVIAELIGAVVLLGMFSIGIRAFIRSWEARQPVAPPVPQGKETKK